MKVVLSRHSISYILNKRHNFREYEISNLLNKDRSNTYNSVFRAEQLLDVKDVYMIEAINNWAIVFGEMKMDIENEQPNINDMKEDIKRLIYSYKRKGVFITSEELQDVLEVNVEEVSLSL